MTRKRYVAILFGLLIVAAAALWWGGIRRASANTIQPDVNSLALVPAQATTIFGLDLDGLRASSIYSNWRQRHLNEARPQEYNEFVARTGFDVERDVDAVTAAAWKTGVDPASPPAFLAVVTARYNPSAVASFLKEKGAATESYRGFELLLPEASHSKPGHPTGALVLLDDRTILAGTDAAVKQALDLKLAPGASVLNNQGLLDRVRTIGIENQIWAVSIAPGAFLPPHLPAVPQANVARVLQGLQGSTFAVNATSGLHLLMEGSCATDADARTLADAARGILAMLRLMAPADRPEALQLLNSFAVEQQQQQVKVTAQIASQLLDELMQKPEMFLPHGRHESPQKR